MRPAQLRRALRGRSAGELYTRLAQLLSSRAEARGLGGLLDLTDAGLARSLAAGEPRDPAELLARFRGGGRPIFFAGPADPTATAHAVASRRPEHRDATIARADRVLGGRFDLLGFRELDYGQPPDWQRDPVAGRSAPLVPWSRVPYLDPAVVGDHKITWEVNRQQYLVTLGQAYAYTGDERYAHGFATLVESWADANPPKLGINWASSLEVAFRAMSWVWALHLFRNSDALTPSLYGRMLGLLHVHGRHLERYLSTYFSPNTHLTGEALGLVYLGVLLPELRHAHRWRELGTSVLAGQLDRHVRPDGVYFEQASQYHRYTTEIYLQLLLLGEANGIALPARLRPALGALFDHLLYLARPDGTIPLLGDDDGGRLTQLDERLPADVRALFATGAVVLQRDDLAFAARGDVAAMAWLLGADGLARFDALAPTEPTDRDRAFPDGGFFTMRSDWSADADWAVLDCGPHGTMNCGHAHADALALEVAIDGRSVLVDSGTYSYPGPERNEFRGTAAHNAVTVDGASSSEPAAGAFQWTRIASCRHDRWISTDRFAAVAGTHDGFATLASPVAYRRELLMLRGDYWIVRDLVDGRGDEGHEVGVHWHAAPTLSARILQRGGGPAPALATIADDRDRSLLDLVVATHVDGELAVEPGWVSPTYGAREAADRLTWRQSAAGPQEIVTVLRPRRGAGTAPAAEIVTAVAGGLALTLTHAGGTDWLLLGSGRVMLWDDVRTDAAWLWLRRGPDNLVREIVALDATLVEVGGRAVLAGGPRRPWFALASAGEMATERIRSDDPTGVS